MYQCVYGLLPKQRSLYHKTAGPLPLFIGFMTSPQARSSARDDKGEGAALPRESGGWLREQQVPPLRFASVGMTKVRVGFHPV